MRSSIACSRCRRSKIKCVNNGIDTTCRACASSGRECAYPTPAVGGGGGGGERSAGGGTASKRDIAVANGGDGDDRNGEWDSPKRQRSRKSMNSAFSNGNKEVIMKQNAMLSALDSPVLTPKVWEELSNLFQLHFATTLTFLHPATFLAWIRGRQSMNSGNNSTNSTTPTSNSATLPANGQSSGDHSQSPRPAAKISPLVLLGVLTLTARFHPQLIQHHSPSSPVSRSNPLAASEFYANVLRARLVGADGTDIVSTDISRVQAYLMLGLHEWGMCRGKNAWIYVGMAIRLSQAMGLPFDSEYEVLQPSSPSRPPSHVKSEQIQSPPLHKDAKGYSSDDVIEEETKRRTFWSCFTLDRYLSSGKYRPRMIMVRHIDIQLPSDQAFSFGERIRTSKICDSDSDTGVHNMQHYDPRSSNGAGGGMKIPSLRQTIGYPDDANLRNGSLADTKHWPTYPSYRSDSAEDRIDRRETGNEESVSSRLIRIIRIWGSVAKWSCSGGRRFERHPPWEVESTVSRLRESLAEFQYKLPRNLEYDTRITDTHIIHGNTLAPYSLMHILYFLSVIVLHRAYLPFLPLHTVDPQGPIDEPSFPPEEHYVPDGFWKDSAKRSFRAASQMMELIRICHGRGVLTETPLVGFAIYNAALMGVYAIHFNHMDQAGYLCSKANTNGTVLGAGGQGQADVRKAIEILGEMRPRLKMASGWFRTLHRLHVYYSKAKGDYKRAPINSEKDSRANGRNNSSLMLEEFRLLDRLFMNLGSTEDQKSEMNGSDDEIAAILFANPVKHEAASDTTNHAVKVEPSDGFETPRGDVASGARRDSWVPVNGSIHPQIPPSAPTPPTMKDGGDRAERNPISKPSGLPSLENGRWPTLPAPSHTNTFSLPSYRDILTSRTDSPPNSALTQAQLPPPQVSSSSPSNAPPASPPAFLLPEAFSGKLQPIQPLPRQQNPTPAYSQSLPYVNAAAQQSFPRPPIAPNPTTTTSLATTTPLLPNIDINHHSFNGSGQTLTPPPRLDSTLRPLPHLHSYHSSYTHPPPQPQPMSHPSASQDRMTNGSNNSPASMTSLGGDDVIVFIDGDTHEKWSSVLNSRPGVSSGWLNAIWSEHGT